jgi:hypothetical protein
VLFAEDADQGGGDDRTVDGCCIEVGGRTGFFSWRGGVAHRFSITQWPVGTGVDRLFQSWHTAAVRVRFDRGMKSDAPATVKQIYAIAAVLCEKTGEVFPRDRGAASGLLDKLKGPLPDGPRGEGERERPSDAPVALGGG